MHAPTLSMSPVVSFPPSGTPTAPRPQLSLPSGPGPASLFHIMPCCCWLLECCPVLLDQLPQIPPAFCDTAKLFLTVAYPLLPSSPHLNSRLGDFWILGLPVLQHLPRSDNLELLTKAVKGESQLVTVAKEGCCSGFLAISTTFGCDILSSSQILRLKTVGIHTPAVVTISWAGYPR